MPTRPFFVQPYSRSHISRGDDQWAYGHGYRHGYRDGSSDHHNGHSQQGQNQWDSGHGNHDRWNSHHGHSGFQDRYGDQYRGNWNGIPNYYVPRSGVSVYYQSH
ncbi:MAG: hypothetical protein EXR86_01980 [Gammaproteobacteria bacterium]|nr:hypothetical protein [Gammaproteobacteria bacterium]